MRLVFFASEFPPGPGGIGTHAHQVTLNLVKMGWEVVVIAPQDYAADAEVVDFVKAQPFTIVRLRPIKGSVIEALYRWRVGSRWIKKFRPDVLMASGSRASWIAAALSRRHRIPMLAIGHGTEFGDHGNWATRVTRRAFNAAAGVVCVSEYTWGKMREAGIRPRQGRVIPNGADDTVYEQLPQEQVEEFRASLGFGDARLLLTVGNVTDRKGQEVVIRAMPQVLEKIPNAHYLMAGLPTKKEEFSRIASELNVSDHVHFLGRVKPETLVALFNSCDVFVMTSKHTADGDFEGYGIAVVEAALCGRPSVVSANSGLAEAIVDNITGLGVPEGDSERTAQALVSLLKDNELRRRMSVAALERARHEQTWEQRVREYDSFLRALGEMPDAKPMPDYVRRADGVNS
jgi:phosphatidylinositol alpha-1,6-mannosyltransferase